VIHCPCSEDIVTLIEASPEKREEAQRRTQPRECLAAGNTPFSVVQRKALLLELEGEGRVLWFREKKRVRTSIEITNVNEVAEVATNEVRR